MEKSAYDIHAGDKFRFGGRTYWATQDARGEFNAYVRVFSNDTGADDDIVIPHGTMVEVVE
jgi:hypothetical protein